MTNSLIHDAAQTLYNAGAIAILTGAGVSKESGVPTFRDAQEGLWAQYDPQELATMRAFRQHPKRVWDWYAWRRSLVKDAAPNPGHIALSQLEDYAASVALITQNVDDLHEQAGSKSVIHLHGNIARNKCVDNCQGNPTPIDLDALDYDADSADEPPHCPHCGAFVRPDVVWFGESLPQQQLSTAFDASETCDVMLVVGTSALVSPASQLPHTAKRHGATVIEVNPDTSAISRLADIKLTGKSGEMLPQVLTALDTIANA